MVPRPILPPKPINWKNTEERLKLFKDHSTKSMDFKLTQHHCAIHVIKSLGEIT